MDDYTPIEEPKGDSMMEFWAHILSNIRYRSYFLIFIIFILVTSDVFANIILSKLSGAEINGMPTPYGCIVQGLVMVFAVAALDGLEKIGCL